MIRVTVVGSGSVAEGLAHAIAQNDEAQLVQIYARSGEKAAQLASMFGCSWSDFSKAPLPADYYMLAVSDRAVGEVSSSLGFPEGSVVAHTAGCVDIGEIASSIEHRAVLYPLQSFTKGRAIENFRHTPFFIEGNTPHALHMTRTLAAYLSDNVIEMPSADRARIHMAGSFVNNFTNFMYTIGERIAGTVGAPFDYLKPIIEETVCKALEISPQRAQTGAAQRGDRSIQQKHLHMLEQSHPEYIELYKIISEGIWQISKKNFNE